MDKLIDYLKPIYAFDTEKIKNEILVYAKTVNKIDRTVTNPWWYKFIELYAVYPDSIIYDKKLSPLKNLIHHIPHVKRLGCNAMHILPFLESPMIDKGFDVSDYFKIRKELGTLADLLELKKEAEREGVYLFMDLVFNHVSDQHVWFQRAQQNQQAYRNYFIYTKDKPNFIRKFHFENAVWAEYEVEGKRISVNVAFPEFAGEIPHWRQGVDGYWYYHTYYPQQLDLNWLNPQVFINIAKVVIYWGSLGFNFRLDAIPFVGKSAYKRVGNDNEKVHLITAALKHIAEYINPESLFIVETYEPLPTVIEYFGTSNRIQANLSYNFHLCTNIWVSLVKHDAQYIWRILEEQKEIPKHAEWLNFLRNHDELSLAYLDTDLTRTIRKQILKYGKDFREGFGISGRTFSMLGGSTKRFLMAYFLLASLPGGIVIPYGDEIAAHNIALSKLGEIEKKDTRNINRGVINAQHLRAIKSKRFIQSFACIIDKRKRLREYLNVWPEQIEAPKEIFAVRYKLGISELVIYINLSAKPRKLSMDLTNFYCLAKINSAVVNGNLIKLGPYAGIWLQK